ncbi:hypothetical protein BDZ97DRAFT_1848847 [Flammula alnicola]|nr:hypothetical protein BDZ97DRAFT_1848847 [Flammula alnicola]
MHLQLRVPKYMKRFLQSTKPTSTVTYTYLPIPSLSFRLIIFRPSATTKSTIGHSTVC